VPGKLKLPVVFPLRWIVFVFILMSLLKIEENRAPVLPTYLLRVKAGERPRFWRGRF